MDTQKWIIITGGCGFIGHHIVQHIHRNTNYNIIIIDKLSYASKGYQRLRDLNLLHDPRIVVFPIDLIGGFSDGMCMELARYNIEHIVHLAAATHVDNSIEDPANTIHNNVMSTVELLEYTRKHLKNICKFVYFSTDEVFGPAPDGTSYKEWDRHNPTNPYSASKSAAEGICLSYQNTYGIPVIIINVMNVFGERQHVEKFIPMTILNVLAGNLVTIHAYPKLTRVGSRFYIHARNVASAVMFLLDNGKPGDKYNVVGNEEIDNLQLAQIIADTLEVPLKYELVDFHSKRPGHDLRYALDGEKLQELGWKPPLSLMDSLRKTIMWTSDHKEWLEK